MRLASMRCHLMSTTDTLMSCACEFALRSCASFLFRMCCMERVAHSSTTCDIMSCFSSSMVYGGLGLFIHLQHVLSYNSSTCMSTHLLA